MSECRPYRSHKLPACETCRKHKSRCTVDIPGQSCLLCRIRGKECLYMNAEEAAQIRGAPHSAPSGPSKKRQRLSNTSTWQEPLSATTLQTSETGHLQPPSFTELGSAGAAHILGPAGAHDARVLEEHMRTETDSRTSSEPGVFGVYSSDLRRPILYATPHQKETKVVLKPRLKEREILDQIVGHISVANAALSEDFKSPRLLTVLSCLVELNSRPVLSVLQNTLVIGRVVTLAYSFGLNHNPVQWRISQEEKNYRVRLWWGVFIHDTW
jgi:hypothetical protein